MDSVAFVVVPTGEEATKRMEERMNEVSRDGRRIKIMYSQDNRRGQREETRRQTDKANVI